jgi:opacity protein-like surface antigen
LTLPRQGWCDFDVLTYGSVAVASLYAAAVLCAAAWPQRASAEPYLAAYAGAGFTQSKDLRTELELNGVPVVNGRAENLHFDTSAVFGAKAGYFFPVDVLGGNTGLELDVYHFEPNAPRQFVKFSGMLGGVTGDTRTQLQSADIQVTAISVNAIYRFRLAADAEHPLGRIQPYVGIGAGAFIARLATTTSPFDVNSNIDDTQVRAGVQALAGARWLVTRNIALFAEYKFVQTDTFAFRFKQPGTISGFPFTETARDRADLTSHLVYGGVGFHW